MYIGKIVKSDSHINYVCQIYGPREVELEPTPTDYAFGRFVRIAVRAEQSNDHDPAFGSLGPRLSNETQVELFSPDYISEKAVLIYVMVLGMIEQRMIPGSQPVILSIMHGVPLLSLELGSEIETMTDEEVQAFHFFGDPDDAEKDTYLHMGYLPHIIAQRNSLLPMVTLRIIDQLERLFPKNLSILSIVKRNFAWRLKVETTG